MGKLTKAPTRAEENIGWIERHCFIPEGRDAGKPVVLREWQKAELRKIYDNPHGTQQAILSFPRKNGKTALIAFLLLLHLCGPESKLNSQLYSAAQSQDQAAVIYKLAAKIVRMSPTLSAYVVPRDTVKELWCERRGTLYKALSAEAKTKHGTSPIFVVHDELGQVRGPTSELYTTLETGMGAHEETLSIIISTQAPGDADLLSTLIDKALDGGDPHTVVSVYSAPMDADPFAEETLKACNPAWGDFLNPKTAMKMMEDAKALPSMEPAYRNLHLNQRVEATAPFINRTLWDTCGAPVVAEFDGPVFMGLDLSQISDLTANVALSLVNGVWHAKPTFWLPSFGLVEKARKDRVQYDVWAKQGHLIATPGKTVDYDYVAPWLYATCQKMDVRRIAYDRWNFRHLKPCLLRAGFTEDQLEGDNAIFVQFGQGFKDMSPALMALEAEVLNGRLAHGGHPVLAMCAANAAVEMDAAGNRKLAKHKSHGRIDGMVALAMAMAVATSMVDATDDAVSFWEVA